MTTLSTVILTALFAVAAAPTTTPPPPACSNERSAYASAKAAVLAARNGAQSKDEIQAAYADLEAKKNVFMCCLHPTFKSCTN